ncbi:hypothetical protein HDV57DRAFT_234164 [Trichoderma longibrachiatum]|uniref:Uncharacterized protein n=1 Tax=Trichoderma longibrachiatum ATCC 18648 TaxID=983965 RepID=A0A2T4CE95_TRILO|nr:hypothetical protein M440DRAFT_172951 [Trichoderma longibrachiatum ATCC 18648]
MTPSRERMAYRTDDNASEPRKMNRTAPREYGNEKSETKEKEEKKKERKREATHHHGVERRHCRLSFFGAKGVSITSHGDGT